jgi:23S rRNA (guanine745-N1)-methyltransferase
MHVSAAANLACPLDGLALVREGGVLRCVHGHSFDVAREGYCNALAVQHKASLDPGDSREMVAARRRFLDSGAYAPIAGAVFEVLRGCATARRDTAGRPFHVLDAGCGEGYYPDRWAQIARSSPACGELALAGIDVSKWAVKAAARRPAPVSWLVANNRHPPFLPGSVDLICCLFGFAVWEGFQPIQAAGGHVLLVDPGPDHLIELRRIIYPVVTATVVAPIAPSAAALGYRLVRQDAVRFPVVLSGHQQIGDLLAMTPHAHRMAPAGREALARCQALDVTADVCLRLLVLGS